MTTRVDAVVVGGGLDGLVAALRVARAGRSVVVCEAREELGGLFAPREVTAGRVVPGPRGEPAGFPKHLERALGLSLERRARELFTAVGDDGRRLAVPRDRAQAAALGPDDREGYGRWRAFIDRVTPLLSRLAASPPPPLDPGGVGDLVRLGRLGLSLRWLGATTMTELLRIAPMCVADWLQEELGDPLLVEGLAAGGVLSTRLGPWSAGSAANLLLTESLAAPTIVGGAARLVEVLSEALGVRGAEVRTGERVAGVAVSDDGRVAGVELEGGGLIASRLVVATCSPRHLLLDLVPPGRLPSSVVREVETFRCRGTAAVLEVAFDGSPPADATPLVRVGGGHVDRLEQAFDAVKHRRLPEAPHLEVRLGPAPGFAASVLVSFVPHDLAGGWTAAARESLTRSVLDRLERWVPGLGSRVAALELLSPLDLEAGWSLPGGQLQHGEHALDQLASMRPGPELSGYLTPVPGLVLGGAGTHPGTLAPGLSGWLGAGAALASS